MDKSQKGFHTIYMTPNGEHQNYGAAIPGVASKFWCRVICVKTLVQTQNFETRETIEFLTFWCFSRNHDQLRDLGPIFFLSPLLPHSTNTRFFTWGKVLCQIFFLRRTTGQIIVINEASYKTLLPCKNEINEWNQSVLPLHKHNQSLVAGHKFVQHITVETGS